jgi:L-seryl-tRNA(Ser) seleniumtransferase
LEVQKEVKIMDVYEQLGVKKLINAFGPVTKVGGSLMPREVVDAMAEASRAFVDMDELLEKAGERIAQIIGVEAAFVTSGAAAGLAIAAAACMTGADAKKAKQLPDTDGMKHDIVILRCHRIHYDQAVKLSGARFVEVGFSDFSGIDDIESFLTEQTAAILYIAKGERAKGSVPLRHVIELGKTRGVPVIVDAADEVPPLSNLRRFNDMGGDLVLFSGGKDIRGPQASGLILGKRPLIRACAVNGSPNYGIGRPMKISKEVVIGLVRGVELYGRQDFEAEMGTWEKQRDYLVQRLSKIPHMKVCSREAVPPGSPGSFYLPAAYVNLDDPALGMTKAEVIRKLKEGNPGIVVGESPDGIILRVHMLERGEEALIADRLIEILCEKASTASR